MTKHSLKVRLLFGQAVAIILALAVAGFALVVLFERHVERKVGNELDNYLTQLVARIQFEKDGTPYLKQNLSNPQFESVFSGLYWQIINETKSKSARSRSLWDIQLHLPDDKPEIGLTHMHRIPGPEGSTLLIHERRLIFQSEGKKPVLRFATAIDAEELTALTTAFAREVVTTLIILAVVLFAVGWFQVTIGLQPLNIVKQAIADIRGGRTSRMDDNIPSEIAPLVEEINGLIAAQETSIKKARERAADLAHGFKTPLTTLITDVRKLREKGEQEIADGIETTSSLMRRQIERELAKARIRDKKPPEVEIESVLASLIKTLKRTPSGEHKTISIDMEPDLSLKMDQDDLSDILGNLMENALRYARKNVLVTARSLGDKVLFVVEDDGEGVLLDQHADMVARGIRYDRSAKGSGLGLAIVNDVLDHYNEKLTLETSGLGGLKARFEIPKTN